MNDMTIEKYPSNKYMNRYKDINISLDVYTLTQTSDLKEMTKLHKRAKEWEIFKGLI